jgi:hypothetical protein
MIRKIPEQAYLRKKLKNDNPVKSSSNGLLYGKHYGEKVSKTGKIYVYCYRES